MSARAESGTITLWLLGLCLVLFALGGISLDLWRAFSERRALRRDRGRRRARRGVRHRRGVDTERRARCCSIRRSPRSGRVRTSRSSSTAPRSRSVSVHADTEAVTVVVRGNVGFTLLGVLAPRGDFDVQVTATATPRRSG